MAWLMSNVGKNQSASNCWWTIATNRNCIGVLRVEWIESLFGMIAQLFAIALEVSVDASAFVFRPLALEMMSQVFPNQGFVCVYGLTYILFFQPFPHCSIILEYFSWW